MHKVDGKVRFAVAGMGGYAASITDALLKFAATGEAAHEVVAACDPAWQSMPPRVELLKGRGIEIFDSFDAMLDAPADAPADVVWLPVPIQLHRPFAERALARGKHVVCEKPAAGSVQDIDAMIAARDRSDRACLIGFQDVYQPSIHALKKRLVNGDLGTVAHATLIGCWPRPLSYFARNNWAGRLKVGDAWVLDSPANNAMAHFVHLALFLLGDTEKTSARPVSVTAELYRANAIENFDTCTIQGELDGGRRLDVAMTHACETSINPLLVITTDRTTVHVQYNGMISYRVGEASFESPMTAAAHRPMIEGVVRHLRGDTDAPVGTLEMARAHTVLLNAASAATPVHDVPDRAKQATPTIIIVPGIEQALQQCVDRRQTLHETGLFDWTRPPGRFDSANYTVFEGPRL